MATLLWLQGGACSGNTMSFLNAEEPSVCDLVTDFVKREEYGFMKGKILSITDYPVTPERVRMLVANESLAADLLGKSSKFEVRIGLVEDTKTPSGYAWSSSQGPPFRVDGGTQLVVSVVVERRRPISMILPIIRGSLGAS